MAELANAFVLYILLRYLRKLTKSLPIVEYNLQQANLYRVYSTFIDAVNFPNTAQYSSVKKSTSLCE